MFYILCIGFYYISPRFLNIFSLVFLLKYCMPCPCLVKHLCCLVYVCWTAMHSDFHRVQSGKNRSSLDTVNASFNLILKMYNNFITLL